MILWLLVFLSAYQGDEINVEIILDHEKPKTLDEKKQESLSPPLVGLDGFATNSKKSLFVSHQGSAPAVWSHNEDVLRLSHRSIFQRGSSRVVPSAKSSSHQRSPLPFNESHNGLLFNAFNIADISTEKLNSAQRHDFEKNSSVLEDNTDK